MAGTKIMKSIIKFSPPKIFVYIQYYTVSKTYCACRINHCDKTRVSAYTKMPIEVKCSQLWLFLCTMYDTYYIHCTKVEATPTTS